MLKSYSEEGGGWGQEARVYGSFARKRQVVRTSEDYC